MSYSELTRSERIILAVECVALGVVIPNEIAADLGAELIAEIENPGEKHADG